MRQFYTAKAKMHSCKYTYTFISQRCEKQPFTTSYRTKTGRTNPIPKPAARQKLINLPGVLALRAEQGRLISFCLAASPECVIWV